MTSADLTHEPTSRREWLAAAPLIALGIVLRLWVASHSAVEHFDEGVYASNLYFGEPDFAYPHQHLYAPPLLPTLIEIGMALGLPDNMAPLLPAVVAGSLMLVALWRIARRWISPSAALATLALASLSDFHAAYSATALTDVPLTLFTLLAVFAIVRAFAIAVEADAGANADSERQPRKATSGKTAPQPSYVSWSVVAGLLTAAGWWTKYNGWLPLLIAGSGLLLLLYVSKEARPSWKRLVTCAAIMFAAAGLAWSPVLWNLQNDGGYQAVAANHSKYIVGFAGWFNGAARHLFTQQGMEGALSWVSVGVATLVAALVRKPAWDDGRFRPELGVLTPIGIAIGLSLFAALESTFVVLFVLSAIGVIGRMSTASQRMTNRNLNWEQRIAPVLLLTWWGNLLLSTPTYWPYPRLTLPWTASAWIGAGICIAAILGQHVSYEPDAADKANYTSMRAWLRFACVVALLLPMLCIARQQGSDYRGSLAIDRIGVRQVAEQMKSLIEAEQRSSVGEVPYVIDVAGEPAMYFQLLNIGCPFVSPVQDLPTSAVTADGQPVPTYLIVGPHSLRDANFQAQWQANGDRHWEEVPGSPFPYRPSPIVKFDLLSPDDRGPQQTGPSPKAASQTAAEAEFFHLYRIRDTAEATADSPDQPKTP